MATSLLMTFESSRKNLKDYASLFSSLIDHVSKTSPIFESPALSFPAKDIVISSIDDFPALIMEREMGFDLGIAYENSDQDNHDLSLESYSPVGFSHSVDYEGANLGLSITEEGDDSTISLRLPDNTDRATIASLIDVADQMFTLESATATTTELRSVILDETVIQNGTLGWISLIDSSKALDSGADVIKTLPKGRVIVAVSENAPVEKDDIEGALTVLKQLYSAIS